MWTTVELVSDSWPFTRLLLTSPAVPDPHSYTTGRWLHRDQEQLKSRHIDFSFPALLNVALKVSPGAGKVTKYDKVEGGFNRAFLLQLDNDKRVVARIPFHHAGAPGLRTNSEVATLSYCNVIS